MRMHYIPFVIVELRSFSALFELRGVIFTLISKFKSNLFIEEPILSKKKPNQKQHIENN